MVEKGYRNFTELEVWKKARILKNEIAALVKSFPAEEKYRLADQIVRSSRSINSNIAEGHGRYTNKDQIHFFIQARGSLSETLNHLIDAFDCGFLKKNQLFDLKLKIDEVGKLLNGYIGFLRNKN